MSHTAIAVCRWGSMLPLSLLFCVLSGGPAAAPPPACDVLIAGGSTAALSGALTSAVAAPVPSGLSTTARLKSDDLDGTADGSEQSVPVTCTVRDGVVRVDECGDGFKARDSAGQPDHTEVIQAALNSSAHTVVLRNLSASTPWVARPLFIVRNDTLLKFEASAFLHAKRGRDCRRAGQDTCFHGTDDSMLRLKSAMRNVSIIGESGATVRMWKQDYLNRTEYMKGEWRMGIYVGHETNNESAFAQCQDIVIKGLNIEQSGGDGIYVDNCERVHIAEVNSDGNYRQGLSIIGAKHMLVENCNFSNTKGTAPAAGIDLEPDGVYYDLENITIRDCYAVNNTGHGLQSWLNSGEAHNISVLIERYHIIGSSAQPKSGGFVFGRLHPPGGAIRIRDSTVESTAFDGIYVWDELLDNNGPGWDFHLIFENVTLRDTASNVGALAPYSDQPGFAPQLYAPIGLDSLATYGDSGLELNGVTVYDSIRRPIIQANPKWGNRSVSGTLRVIRSDNGMGCDINASRRAGPAGPFPNLKVECVQE